MRPGGLKRTDKDLQVGAVIQAHLDRWVVDRWLEGDRKARPTRAMVEAAGYRVVDAEGEEVPA